MIEPDDYRMNYGAYANRSIVDTSSQRYMLKLSIMKFNGNLECRSINTVYI